MTTIKSLADRLLASHAPNAELGLDFDGYIVLVRSNSQELVRDLGDYFRDFRAVPGSVPHVTIHALETPPADLDFLDELDFSLKQPDPGKSKIKEEFVDFPDGRAVRKRLTGMVFLFGANTHLAAGPCLANDNQVVNFINNRFIAWTLDQGSLLFHAAGVARNSRGLAMAGFSGMGKSTLALHVMDLDADFVSNDRLMVRRVRGELIMHGVAKMPRVNPGTVLNNPRLASVMSEEDRERFADLPQDELWSLEHKYDAFIDECFGPGKFSISARMEHLVLLNWRRDGEEDLSIRQVDLAARPDLMPAFMKEAGLFYGQPGAPARVEFPPEDYLALLGDCPVWELTGRVDFQRAAVFCKELLDKD